MITWLLPRLRFQCDSRIHALILWFSQFLLIPNIPIFYHLVFFVWHQLWKVILGAENTMDFLMILRQVQRLTTGALTGAKSEGGFYRQCVRLWAQIHIRVWQCIVEPRTKWRKARSASRDWRWKTHHRARSLAKRSAWLNPKLGKGRQRKVHRQAWSLMKKGPRYFQNSWSQIRI